ncbi:MAG TPA: ABC transporter ATP-binding protein [Acidimicrobiia bacterium]|nr:ABC transporter ATP-binding protein [Acidimicrobiia bacterium]
MSDQVTVYDLQSREDARIELRRLPRLIRHGLRVIVDAGRREFILSTVLQVFSGVSVALSLLIGQRALQALLEVDRVGSGFDPVVPWAVALAVVTGASLFASSVQREQQQILGELVGRHMQQATLEVATRVDLAAFEHPDFHNRLQRVQSATGQPLNMVYGLSGIASALIGVVGVAAALIAIEPLLIPMVLVVLLPAWLAASRRGSEFWRFFWRMTPRDRERNYLGHLLAGRDEAKEVRAFGLGRYLLGRWNRLYDERLSDLRQVARRQLRYSLLATAVIGTVLGATVLLVAWLASSGRVSLSEAGIAVAGIAVIGARLTGAGYSAASLSEAGFYLDDFKTFLALGTPPLEATSPPPSGFKAIVAEDVTFTYPSSQEPALIDVSLHIDAGEIVALVGENGSGKSTLAKLLAGLYAPASGRITWDGIDISSLDQTELSKKVAVIFQDFIRYHLDVTSNIGFGNIAFGNIVFDNIGYSDNGTQGPTLLDAARQAGADEFIDKLPRGYETLLGPEFLGGVDLSVGQWQRIALARAFFRDAPLIILDEPTASLDARAEHELFARIRTLLAGRTVLLISHRFSSVRAADRVYVLHEGRVVEAGTHAELIAAAGRYAEMYTMQAEAYR